MSRSRVPIRERLLARIDVDDATGCWLWTGTLGTGGYGRIHEGGTVGRTFMAHRVAYELFVGPIPAGLTLDHLCRVRHCVNPAHLEPVTISVNLHRGDTPAARNAAKTHCPASHPLSGENLYVYADGRRTCRTCIRDRARERMRAKRRRSRVVEAGEPMVGAAA